MGKIDGEQKNSNINKKIHDKRIRQIKLALHSPAMENKNNLCPEQLLRRCTIVADEVGHFPSSREMQKYDEAARQAIVRRWRTWNEFKRQNTQENIREKNQVLFPNDKILYLIREWASLKGCAPTSRDFNKGDKKYPSTTTVLAHFGSWNRALAMAGITPVRIRRRTYGSR